MKLGRALSPALLLLLALTACSGGSDDGFEVPVPDAKIDVDTPKLRQLKAAAEVEPCRAGDGANEMPDASLPCLGGGPDVRLDTLAGPAVVNFWASWCDPCRKELPVLQQASEQYAGRVAFVGVDLTDPQTEAAMQLIADSGVTYPQLADPGGALSGAPVLKRLVKVPTTAFVDADGGVEVVVAPIESVDELETLIDEHLGVSS